MQPSEVAKLITDQLPGSEVIVESDDNTHYQMVVVSDAFEGLNRVKRQQLVYQFIGTQLNDGTIHAVAMKTLTPAEWAEQQSS